MKTLSRSLLVFAVSTLSAGSLAWGQAVELKQQWQIGKRYVLAVETEQSTAMEIAGQKMDQKMHMLIETSTTVGPHEDGRQKRLTTQMSRIAMDMNMAGQAMGFDSDKPQKNDAQGFGSVGKEFSRVIGKKLKLVANEKDEVTDIENFEEFAGELGPEAAGNPLGQMFTKKSMLDMFKQSGLQAMPAGPVKPGDSWDWNQKMELLGFIEMGGKYTFKGMAERGGAPCAEVAMQGELINYQAAAPEPGAGPQVPNMQINSLKLTGTVWFDTALGMTREMVMHQAMEMEMENPIAKGQKMTLPTKQVVTVKLKKVEDAK